MKKNREVKEQTSTPRAITRLAYLGHFVLVYAIWVLASAACAWIFTITIMGPQEIRYTDLLSTFVGWQWVLLIGYAGYLLVRLLKDKDARTLHLLVASLVVLVGVIAPAAQVRSSRLFYREYIGGPSGPEFTCLIWKNSYVSGEYGGNVLGVNVCTIMSIPAYTRYLDNGSERRYELSTSEFQKYDRSRTEKSFIYAEMLFAVAALYGVVIIGKNKDE